jgi:nucleoside-diphosphate-sugar epimerase
VAVTGANGFIGRQCVAPLRERGFEVIPVGSRDVDLLDPAATAAFFASTRASHLLHLAWYAEPGRFWTAAQNIDWLAASLLLVRAFAAAGGERVVTAGTCAEYDWGSAGVLEERVSPIAPATLYGTCKAALGSVLGDWADGPSHAHGRIFWLHGPHEQPGRLISSVAAALLAGAPADCTAGTQVRDFVHVADAADAFAALIDAEVRGAVNVGSGEGIPVRELVERFAAALGRPDLPRFGAAATGEPPVLIGAADRLRALGWKPRRSIEDTAAWWRSTDRR